MEQPAARDARAAATMEQPAARDARAAATMEQPAARDALGGDGDAPSSASLMDVEAEACLTQRSSATHLTLRSSATQTLRLLSRRRRRIASSTSSDLVVCAVIVVGALLSYGLRVWTDAGNPVGGRDDCAREAAELSGDVLDMGVSACHLRDEILVRKRWYDGAVTWFDMQVSAAALRPARGQAAAIYATQRVVFGFVSVLANCRVLFFHYSVDPSVLWP